MNEPNYADVEQTRVCIECEEHGDNSIMKLTVLHTPAGYYLGFWCDNHGPYSRETHYMRKREAEQILAKVMERNNGNIS